MSMETTCPGCHTTFRVTTEQLNAHQGDVRCGVCALLFNAFESLAPAREETAMSDTAHEPEAFIEPADVMPTEEMVPVEETEISLDLEEVLAPATAPAAEFTSDLVAAIESMQASEPEPSPVEFPPEAAQVSVEDEDISLDLDKVLEAAAESEPVPLTPEIEEAAVEVSEAVAPAPEAKAEPAAETAPERKIKRVPAEVQAIEDIYADFAKAGVMPPAADATAELAAQAEATEEAGTDLENAEIVPRPAVEVWDALESSRKRRFGWLFGLGAVPLLLLLAGQTAYFYRVELASRMPAMRPYLEQACGWIDCTVPLPHNADLLKIESSDLEADTESPSKVTLATTVSNHASYRQAYPLLELTLTNHADQGVARRVFTPNEYLPAANDIKGGMAANSETVVRLSLDLGDLNAVGYRLYVFYAAQR